MEKSEIEKKIAKLEEDGQKDQEIINALAEKANALLIKKQASQEKVTNEIDKELETEEKTYQAGESVNLTDEKFKKIDSEKENPEEWQYNEPEEEGEEDEGLKDEDEEKESEEVKKTRKGIFAWFKKKDRKEKGLEPILNDEEIEELKKEAQESEEKKQGVRGKILARLETEKKTEAQENSFYGKANKGLDWWENLGKNEKGLKGFSKRFGKTALNLALIGAISSVSVEFAANSLKLGTAAALGGGTTAYLGKKLLFGLGLSVLMESTNGRKIGPKTKKRIQIVMLAGTIGAGVLLTGGGLAVPLAAGAGMLASRIAQREYSEERTKRKKGEKMEEILKKYDPQKLEGNLERIENEISQTIGQWEERRKFWGKILRGTLALGTSIAFLEVSGTYNSPSEHAEQNNLNNQSEYINKGPLEGQNGQQINETEPLGPITEPIENIPFQGENITFENGAGGIKGIEQLQQQIQAQVDAGEIDLDKAPASVQEFMKEDPTRMAIKLGFFKPGNEAESLSVFEGSTLGFDANGNLSYHDIKTGEDHFLINNNGEINSYEGRMFDSNPVPANPEPEIDKDLANQQVSPKAENSVGNESTNSGDLQNQQVGPITGKSTNPQDINPAQETNSTPESETPTEKTTSESNQNENTTVNKENPYGLSPETLKEVNTTYENNIEKIFPDNKSQNAWNQIKNSHSTNAETVLKMNPEEVKESYKPLISFMQKLKETTNLTPRTETLIQPSETSSEYIKRALEKVAQMGQLDKFKL